MTNDTINEKKNDRFAKDLTALLFIVLGQTLLTVGVALVLGWGGVFILYGSIFGVLGVSLGLSRTGKE
jgi:hypothetical protein